MTENDQAFDAFKTAEPGAEPLDRRVVDLAVSGKWGNRRGNETSQIKVFPCEFSPIRLMLSGSSAVLWRGEPFADRVQNPTGRPAISEDSDQTFQI